MRRDQRIQSYYDVRAGIKVVRSGIVRVRREDDSIRSHQDDRPSLRILRLWRQAS